MGNKHGSRDDEGNTASSSSSSSKGGGVERQSAASKLRQVMPQKATPTTTPTAPFPNPMLLGDDCDRPACDDVANQMKQMLLKSSQQQLQQQGSSSSSSSSSSSTSTTDDKKRPFIVECPPKSGEIGYGSWTLLHSMAAWYPNQPTKEDQEHMTNFMAALARFYPCPWCADDFQKHLKQEPVRTESRTELCQWLCRQHNYVNEKIGKPMFPCDIKSLDERWKKSSNKQCNQGGGGH